MVVLDASVVYKWFVDEKPQNLTAVARNIRKSFVEEKQEVTAPDILLYELANTFAFKTNLESRDILNFWAKLAQYNIAVVSPSLEFMQKAILFSKRYKVSVYDSCYAVLAVEKKCDLITADEKFVKQVNLPFVKALSEYPLG